jgi:gluconolactonase
MVNDAIQMIQWNGAVPFNKISNLSWSAPTMFRGPASRAIGQTADLSGRLITCEMASRRLSITDKTGAVKTLVGNYKGTPLNSPNDVVVKSDGTVWFTDPTYGSLKYPQDANLPCNVYRFDPKSNELTVVISDLVMPNGIAFSPDEKLLYVIDSGASMAAFTYNEKGPHDIHVYDMSADGKTPSNARIFATVTPGFPDGMRLDTEGNLYVGALDGIQVFNPDGKLIGKMLLPRQTANMCFGGKDNNILFICSSDAVWAVRLNAKGAKPVPVLNSGSAP